MKRPAASCEAWPMTNAVSIDELGKRIEQVIADHIAAMRKAAQEAVTHAFGAAVAVPRVPLVKQPRAARAPRAGAATGRTFSRRPPQELAALGERLYQAVCANPGAGMVVLSKEVGAAVRALHRPMTLLRRTGQVRSVGARHLTRYFPMATTVAALA